MTTTCDNYIKTVKHIQNLTFHCFEPIESYKENNEIYTCKICNIYLHLDISSIDYPYYFKFHKMNDFNYWFIFKYNTYMASGYPFEFEINEYITCNEVIIKKLLE